MSIRDTQNGNHPAHDFLGPQVLTLILAGWHFPEPILQTVPFYVVVVQVILIHLMNLIHLENLNSFILIIKTNLSNIGFMRLFNDVIKLNMQYLNRINFI